VTLHPEKVATPLTVSAEFAGTDSEQPLRVPPETVRVICVGNGCPVTMLPLASSTATTGWLPKATPVEVLEGWVRNPSLFALPGGMTLTVPVGVLVAVQVRYTEVTVYR
jgi:hypothetical protein